MFMCIQACAVHILRGELYSCVRGSTRSHRPCPNTSGSLWMFPWSTRLPSPHCWILLPSVVTGSCALRYHPFPHIFDPWFPLAFPPPVSVLGHPPASGNTALPSSAPLCTSACTAMDVPFPAEFLRAAYARPPLPDTQLPCSLLAIWPCSTSKPALPKTRPASEPTDGLVSVSPFPSPPQTLLFI